MAKKEYDLFVIGTGSAGSTVAKECAAAGLKVAVTDKREFGGTCANRGCDPKKVLVGLAEILDRARNLEGKGIRRLPDYSWRDLMKFKKSFTDHIPAATEEHFEESGIDIYHQNPRFLDENSLQLEDQTITAKKIVIATGHKPRDLKIPGIEHALLSEDFLSLPALPDSMIFIGAGYIGMEFAHIAARCGIKVTMMEFAPRALQNYDEEMVTHLQEASEGLGIEFIFNAEAKEIERQENRFVVKADQNRKEISAKANLVFNTSGRVPSIDGLDLEKGNVAFTKKGVEVNDYLQSTTNKNVYACGDVAASAGLPLTPLSSAEAQIVSANVIESEKPKKAKYPPQPSVVFTLPNLASVGFSEEEAKEKGYSFKVQTEKISDWFSARRTNERFYAYKTLVNKENGQILGAHLLGPEAAETINLFAMAMHNGMSADSLKEMLFAYPTWAGDIQQMI